jgi:hypothetical protein
MTTGRRRWGLAALFAVGAVVAAIPAVGELPSEFITEGGPPGYGEAASGDHLQSTYRFWLVGHQLADGGAPWIDPYSFQPLVEPQVVVGGWPWGLPFWPLDALWGPVIAWNLMLLLVTVAAGVFTYLWLRELELPVAAAALGGLAFELAPYRLLQSGGHLLGWAAVFMPLALWAFERSRRAATRRSAHLWGALAAAAVVSIPLSGQLHLALGALPFIVVYALLRYTGSASLWVWSGALSAAAAGLLAETAVISGSSESGGRTLAEVAYYSAEPLDFLSRWRLGGPERFVYLGWLLPVLAVAGVVLLARRRRGLAVLLGLMALLPALLALGTNLPLYEPLRDALPPLRYPRVPGRFLPLANLALAALAAVAVAGAVARFDGRRRTAVAAAFLALVAADLLVFPLRGSEADPDNAAYAALAQAPPGRVLELPIFQRGQAQYGSVYQYYTLQAPRERPTGYALAPASVFEFTERFNRLECGAWLEGDRAELARLGIRFFVWHRGLYQRSRTPGAWFGWEGLRRSGHGPVAGGPTVYLWEEGRSAAPRPDPPDRSEPFLCDAWDDGELTLQEGALWLYGSGTAELELEAPAPMVVSVYADARPVAPVLVSGPTTITVELPNSDWHPIVVRAAPGLRLVRAGFR